MGDSGRVPVLDSNGQFFERTLTRGFLDIKVCSRMVPIKAPRVELRGFSVPHKLLEWCQQPQWVGAGCLGSR